MTADQRPPSCRRATERPAIQYSALQGYRHTYTCGCVLVVKRDTQGWASLHTLTDCRTASTGGARL